MGTGDFTNPDPLVSFNDGWGIGRVGTVPFRVNDLPGGTRFVMEVFDVKTSERIPGAGKSYSASDGPNYSINTINWLPPGSYVCTFSLIDGNSNPFIKPNLYFAMTVNDHRISHERI